MPDGCQKSVYKGCFQRYQRKTKNINAVFTDQVISTSKYCKFENFCALVYVEWCIICMYLKTGSRTDLLLIIDLKTYQAKDEEPASDGRKTFGRNLWYLSGKLIPLCSFDHGMKLTKSSRSP